MKGLSDHPTIEAVLCIAAMSISRIFLHKLASPTCAAIVGAAMNIDCHGEFSFDSLRPEDIDRQTVLTAAGVALDRDQLLPRASTSLVMSLDKGIVSIPWPELTRIDRII
jgi:hypothetical protein